ncbi:hypothetical protein J3R83DRAFT_1442 [Lanmaoa asiatica]|nr:hypothetical protein J3R83DRAFT_1442 [Lanmaoa asiatica]
MKWFTSVAQLAALAPLTVVIVDIIRRIIRNRIKENVYSLPPGPTPFPLLGSAFSVNAKEPWLTYTKWQEKYGECCAKPE